MNISSAQIIATEFLEALGTLRKQYNKLQVLSTFDIWWQTKKKKKSKKSTQEQTCCVNRTQNFGDVPGMGNKPTMTTQYQG